MKLTAFILLLFSMLLLPSPYARADGIIFTTGDPDGRMGMASRPDSAGKIEIEAADDFILGHPASITGASFTGLLPAGADLSTVQNVIVEIYRVFPNDSDVTRTSGPPTFSTSQVPTRVNSPSDVAFDSRMGTFSATLLDANFTAANSVLNGIHPKPNQTTGGEGAVNGEEVLIHIDFATPFSLPPDHYFFVPQVQLSSGEFYWLSAPKPTSPPFAGDLQAWIRNANLDPDWLRVGTDIVGGNPAPTFNGSFTLFGTVFSPALTVQKSASANAQVGRDLTYTINVQNTGNADATNVVLTDPLQPGPVVRSIAVSQGTFNQTFNPSTGITTVTGNLGTIPAGGSATLTIVLRPTNVGQLTNTASAIADTLSAVSSNQVVVNVDVMRPLDVTGQVAIACGEVHDVRQVCAFRNGSTPIQGPLYLVLDDLANARLAHPSGFTHDGSPFIKINVRTLRPNQLVQVLIEFHRTHRGAITHGTRLLAGAGTP
jgi:uncharacterized repeat protein (TIGR01451 family)